MAQPVLARAAAVAQTLVAAVAEADLTDQVQAGPVEMADQALSYLDTQTSIKMSQQLAQD
jgi:hypothetical protein